MSDTAWQIIYGFIGIAGGVVLVLGCYWTYYGPIQRRQERRRLRAFLAAASAIAPEIDLSGYGSIVSEHGLSPEARTRIAMLPDFAMRLDAKFGDD